jgi:ribosomal protein S27AE
VFHLDARYWMMRTLPLYCWNADVAAILLKCGRCRYTVEMRRLPLYCWNADVAVILLICGRCRYSVQMRTLPPYCRNADVAAILLKCGRCRYIMYIIFASGLYRCYYLYNCEILLWVLYAARLIINNVQHVF